VTTANFGRVLIVLLAAMAAAASAATRCPDCVVWNAPQAPFKIFGNTYFVGTHGLTSVLITSDYGHVLIDGGLPESAASIAANIETLGFKVTDIKAILNSHAHFDHAGGIAELQKRSGAPAYARRPSNEVLRMGKLVSSDPQFSKKAPTIPTVSQVWVVSDDQLLGIGSIRLRALATPGHTPGGTTWTWESCEANKCLKMVYADSLTAVSADKFRFTGSVAAKDLEESIAKIEGLACDVIITPHPEQSNLFERIQARPTDKPEAIKDDAGCKKFAQTARVGLQARLESESATR
jgi:metallo-beta-lactamase class B